MKLRKSNDVNMEIDMTPMIDCVFLLLIFFMCAATMSKVDLTPEVSLPVAPRGAVPEDLRGRGTVNILPEGTVLSDGQTVTKEHAYMISGKLMDARGLTTAISARRAEEPELRLYLRVDKNVEFSMVRKAISACAEAGIYDVIFATFQTPQS
ncbi:MAG: biopolymer transporter ExbD [Kiritimatiellae bacterium]|nr:biopolymer transporter ExbD [Kiritimatiellia bacterium]